MDSAVPTHVRHNYWSRYTKVLDQRSSTHVAFLDFSKAFDTVPHSKLSLKLDHIGIHGNVLKWIEGFLANCKQ